MAETGVVPLNVAPPGFVPVVMLTLPVKLGTKFPSASSARNFTAGVMLWSATVVPGCVPNTSWVAAPAVTSNALLAALASPVELPVSQYPVPALLTVTSPKVATPFTAATVVVPPSVRPAPEVPPNATVTLPVKPGTGFPSGSSAVTCNGGASGTPAVTVVGSTVNPSCVAGPGATSKATLVGTASPPPGALAVSV